jgi:hypothetical protein
MLETLNVKQVTSGVTKIVHNKWNERYVEKVLYHIILKIEKNIIICKASNNSIERHLGTACILNLQLMKYIMK